MWSSQVSSHRPTWWISHQLTHTTVCFSIQHPTTALSTRAQHTEKYHFTPMLSIHTLAIFTGQKKTLSRPELVQSSSMSTTLHSTIPKYLQSQHSPHHHRAESVCPLKWEKKVMRLTEEPIKSKTAALSAPTLEPPVWRDEMETATGCCWPDTKHKTAEFNNWILSWVWFYTELSKSTQDAQMEEKEFIVLHNHTKHYFLHFAKKHNYIINFD